MIYAIIMARYHINIIMSCTHWKFFSTKHTSEPNSCNIYDWVSFNNSQLPDVAGDCLKVLHLRCPMGSASEYVVTDFTDFTIFIVPKSTRALEYEYG